MQSSRFLSSSFLGAPLTCLALSLPVLLGVPSEAAACGGFFCDSAQPVNQQAERIIFAREADGDVTAVIQIQYTGPAERFAWMLPVAGSPEVSVSSDAAFQRLQRASNPIYRLNTRFEGDCAVGLARGAPTEDSSAFADAGPGGGDATPPSVSVVDQGFVGPYDYVVISVNPEAEDQVELAITWLQDNGYDVPALGADVLQPYLDAGMNLLAFRLIKGNDAGAIRPVRLSFGPGLPSIPLRPTALATTDDMGILVWVLGESRAIPANYRSLELNEALINWLNPGATYDAVVTRAANEAMGQGFVTEMAGASEPLAEAIWSDAEARQWAFVQETDWTSREGQLVRELGWIALLDGMREVLETHLRVPEGLDPDVFFSCVSCYLDPSETDIEGLEPAALIEDLGRDVIEPMAETRALFEASPFATRMYTTMSAHEMTVDPLFDFNPSLPDVSNVHVADQVVECSASIDPFEAPWRVELPSGQTVRGNGNAWPFATDSEEMPATARISRVGTEGEGEVIADNTAAIATALRAHNATVPGPGADGPRCAASPGLPASPFVSLFGLGAAVLLAARRRR